MSDAKGMDMKNGKTNNSAMYALFGAWYLMGSVVSTFLSGTLVVKIQKDITPGQLGSLMAISGLPWVIKPVWGLIIDRFKTMYWWAMAASVAVALSVLGLMTVESHSYWLIVAAVLLPNVLRSLQDVAVDGLSISISQENQRGAIQTWMRVGTIIGSLLGGAGAMWLKDRMPWFTVCIDLMVVSIIVGVIVPWALASREAHESRAKVRISWKDLAGTFKNPAILLGLFLAVVSVPAQQITYPVFFTWWSSGHYSKNMVTVIFLWAPLFQLIGAALGGWLMKKARSKGLAVAISAPFVVLAYCLVGVKADWTEEAVMALSWFTGMADTIYAVALFALLMDLADKRFTAMSFALLMAGVNLCGVWGPWFGGRLSEDGMSVAHVFLLAGLAQFVVLPVVFAIEKRRK